jgi:hypothetical protein
MVLENPENKKQYDINFTTDSTKKKSLKVIKKFFFLF